MFYTSNTFAVRFDTAPAHRKTIRWLDGLGDNVVFINRIEVVGLCRKHLPAVDGRARPYAVPVAFRISFKGLDAQIQVTATRLPGFDAANYRPWRVREQEIKAANALIEEDAKWMQERIQSWIRATEEAHPRLRLWQTLVREGSQMGSIGMKGGFFHLVRILPPRVYT